MKGSWRREACLVWVFLTAHEDEVLKCVGESIIIVSLRCYGIT